MKLRSYLTVAFILLAFQGLASAEMISGTVTAVNGQNVTLRRADTNETITVRITDADAIRSIQAGSSVSLDADKKFLGGWKAETVQTTSASASSASSARQSSPQSSVGAGLSQSLDVRREREREEREREQREPQRTSATQESRVSASTQVGASHEKSGTSVNAGVDTGVGVSTDLT